MLNLVESKDTPTLIKVLNGLAINPLAKGQLPILEIVMMRTDNTELTVQDAALNCIMNLLVGNDAIINFFMMCTYNQAAPSRRRAAILALDAIVEPVESLDRGFHDEKQSILCKSIQISEYKARIAELEALLGKNNEGQSNIKTRKPHRGAELLDIRRIGNSDPPEVRMLRELEDLCGIIGASATDDFDSALRNHGAKPGRPPSNVAAESA